MHTLIFLTIYAWIQLGSIFHTNVNAWYEDIFTNSKGTEKDVLMQPLNF